MQSGFDFVDRCAEVRVNDEAAGVSVRDGFAPSANRRRSFPDSRHEGNFACVLCILVVRG